MTSTVRIHLALAAVAYALAGKEQQHVKLEHKVVQEHRFGGVMRSEKEKSEGSIEFHSSGTMRSREAVRHSQGEEEEMTQTTTLSAMHLMQTTMQGLAPPPERRFGTTTMPLRPTSQPIDLDNGFALAEVMSKDIQPEDVVNMTQTNATDNVTVAPVVATLAPVVTEAPTAAPTPPPTPPPNPIEMTDQQVQNSEAAFEVSGCSGPMSHFNGVYMPSSMVNTNEACTALVWTYVNQAGRHTLYNIKGAWVLDLEGTTPSYNGADNGKCQPETASWSAILMLQNGAAPTLYRRAAAAYTTTTTVLYPAVGEAQPYYYVVTGAGITGFNGVYYMTPLDVADVRCQRNFAKDGPDNTEYTLAFGNTGSGASVWYFQSLIGGTTNRPYIGSDDGSCSPDTANWQSLGSTGGTAPSVVRSVTATTTTSTTTTATETSTSTTTTTSTTINETALAANETSTSLMLQDQAGTDISTNTTAAPGSAERQFSMMWLRLLLPLSIGISLEGLRCGA